jgi:hypothetical protein
MTARVIKVSGQSRRAGTLGCGMEPKGRSFAYIRSFHLLQEYENGEKVGEVGWRDVSISDSPTSSAQSRQEL